MAACPNNPRDAPAMDPTPTPPEPELAALPPTEDSPPPAPPADPALLPAGDLTAAPLDSTAVSPAEPTAPLSEGDTASPPSEDDLSTPRASAYRSITPDAPESPPDLAAPEENYFPQPLLPRAVLESTAASILSLQNIHSSTSSGTSTPGLQAKATTAISLPEGVHAQQTDGASPGSVAGAPSFSDTNSIVSLVPTLNTRDNDVESMLGEILSESEGRFSGMGGTRAGGGFGDMHIDDEGWDESSDEEGLEEGMADISLVWLFWRFLWGDRREY